MSQHDDPVVAPQPPVAPYGSPAASTTAPQPSQPQKKPLLGRWWFWVIVAVVILGVVGALTGPRGADAPADDAAQPAAEQAEPGAADAGGVEEEASVPAAEEETVAQPQPEEPAPEQAPLPGVGDVVSIDGLEVSVTAVETAVPSVGNEYLSEDAQGAFTLVDIAVGNAGASAATVLSSAFTVLDAEGREFEMSATAGVYLAERGFAFEQINPGNTASGTIAFDLPEGVVPQTLVFRPAIFGGAEVAIALS